MSSQWWFQVIHDQTLRFRCPESSESLRVESVKPENDQMVRVTIEKETVIILNIQQFVGVDMTFNVLEHSVDSHSFCQTLYALMRGKDIDMFTPGQPLMSSPTVTKFVYKCPYQFSEQVEIMRHLHPHCQIAGDNELLDSKNRQWRIAAQRAMQYKGPAGCWGGHFKEAIVVSTISRRCYVLMRSIIATRKTLFLKVSGFMFRGFCGCKDESFMYSLLKKWDQGDISPNDVNNQLKHEKALARPITEVEKLRTANVQLEAKVDALEEEVSILKAKLQEAMEKNRGQTTQPAEVNQYDMYMFETSQETTQQGPQTKRARYTVCYKPDSDIELEDSYHDDPDWNNEEDEKAYETPTESTESDISLNEAFVAIKKWDPTDVVNKYESDHSENKEQVKHTEEDEETFIKNNETTQKADGHLNKGKIKKIKEKLKQTKEKIMRPQRRQTSFAVGQKVMGLFQNGGRDNWKEWCHCKITNILANGDLHKVIFEDGAVRLLRKEHIKDIA